MPDDTDTAQPLRGCVPAWTPANLDRTDRILLGALRRGLAEPRSGASVAATVALVDLGTAHAQSTGESETL